MKALFKGLITGLMLLPALAFAHGASRIEVNESITINAEPAKVWAVVKDFDSLHKWHPAIEATEATGNDVGATRVLTLKDGSTITETLKKFDNENMSYMYQIEEMSKVGEIEYEGHTFEVPAVPVSKYKSWVTVEADGAGTKVTWVGKFFRAYTGNHHEPKELNDETAKAAITGIYKAGLESVKASVE
ncbi:SRPBCC family protein [Methylophaga sp. OBS3]|uniref:SRPBCC family protein n=1 Tax=Methylophaga sp. OBS3 TaxID=2991934 RepID=UPI00224CC914|nr:SRPBCC family protein [Methylophaga sp. OBS3]MCX4190386.1 SRPBCC family protein [Methylophaga sp. OBS3]